MGFHGAFKVPQQYQPPVTQWIRPEGDPDSPPLLEAKRDPKNPKLMFSPYAYSKLNWLCQRANTEVAGFGITPIDDPLYVEDFLMVQQEAQPAYVEFDIDGLSEFQMAMAELGYKFHQFGRIWIHTHPSIGANPSGTDWNTFGDVMRDANYGLMYIMSKDGKQTCHLRIGCGQVGVSLDRSIDVGIDWLRPFTTLGEQADWEREYLDNVLVKGTPTHVTGHWSDDEAAVSMEVGY